MPPPAVKIRPLSPERKLSRGLFDQLSEQIKSGRLAAGVRLPTEEELSRAARVSRTVVREAVAALRADGLVVTRQGVGAFVSAAPQQAPFRIDADRLHNNLEEILHVMELRVCVEIESAGLAAERASRAQLRAIGAALEAMDRATAQGRAAIDEDLELHRTIAEATGNPQFPRFLLFVGRHLIPRHIVSGMPQTMGGQRVYLDLLQTEHRRIVDAVRDHDPKAARDAMRRHLGRSLERYRKLIAEQQAAA